MVERVTSGTRDGLLVGVNYYPDPEMSNLRFAVADATEMYDVLLDSPYDFARNRLILLKSINAQTNEALRRNILRRLYDVAHNGQAGELLLFYYAGHGISINGVPYLCPADVERNLLRETSIPLSQIREIFSQSRASIKLMILDLLHKCAIIGTWNTKRSNI
ncbi:MAG: caspase family protein [Chloroflexota bacterium]